jgi:hypothetical protein
VGRQESLGVSEPGPDTVPGGDATGPSDGGSATLLVPTLLLLIVLLAAIAVDLGHLRQAQVEAQHVARAAANDAVGAALDQARLRAGRGVEIDPTRAVTVARRAVRRRRPGALRVAAVEVRANQETVDVVLTAVVPMIFAPALPGGPDSATVTARAQARIEVR